MKRACPYDANLLRSTKQHFLDHDLDVTARARVHEETLKKLRHGANNSIAMSSAPQAPEVRPIESKSRQMSLTSYFQGKGLQSNDAVKPMCQDASELLPCAYCDKREETCQCRQCGESFCSRCCLTCYNSNEEIVICISCS